jgi:hypothetical protein
VHRTSSQSSSARIVLECLSNPTKKARESSYYAFRLRSFWRLNAHIEPTVRFPPCPVEVSRFSRIIIRVSHKKVPSYISDTLSTSPSFPKDLVACIPSRRRIVARSIEIDPLRHVQIFCLVISTSPMLIMYIYVYPDHPSKYVPSFKKQDRMPSAREVRRNRPAPRSRAHDDVLVRFIIE